MRISDWSSDVCSSDLGLEGILTDAMSSISIQRAIIPHFKQDDYPGGIAAGVNELGKLLALPPDEARARALDAAQPAEKLHPSGHGFMVFFGLATLRLFVDPTVLGVGFVLRRYWPGRGQGS